MMRVALRRIGWAIVVAWFAMTATFAMVVAIPADPAIALLGPHATPDAVARVRAHYCLDRGPLGEYACYVAHVAHGDLGESYRTKQPVAAIIEAHAWPTVQLALAAVALQLALGVPLGVLAAVRRRRWPDRAAGAAVLVAQSAPEFFVGTLLLYALAFRCGWFPIGGYGHGVADRLLHLALPAATLATVGIAYYARIVRAELIDILPADFVRTARAKGVPEGRVVLRHALRPALGGVVALVGLELGALLGGAVVTESIFAWPGLGREVLRAILDVDVPVILGIVLVSALAIALANLLADLVHLWLDPRLRDA